MGQDTRKRVVSHRQRLTRESTELDNQLRELRGQEQEVRRFLRAKAEEEARKALAARDGAEIEGLASDDDIAAIEADLGPSMNAQRLAAPAVRPQFQLPKSLEALAPQKQLVAFAEPDWAGITAHIAANPTQFPMRDVEKFVAMMPLQTRTQLVQKLEQAVTVPTQPLKDRFMEAYAELRQPENVERLLASCAQPTPYSYGHLARAYFRTKNPERVLNILKRMDAHGITPTLPIHTMVVQSLVQHGRYHDAEAVFDNLKYLSMDTQPDVALYNTMMLAAAKEHNTNRVLDLYTEMTTRPIDPLEPNGATYDILVYACSRDERSQLKAWDLVLEARERGFQPSRGTLSALMYLCGRTGEALLARALVRHLCAHSGTYIDSFGINCLFHAYINYDPDSISQVLTSPLGARIRNFLVNSDVPIFSEAEPPLLPVNHLTSNMVVAETKALVRFFAETRPQVLRVVNPASYSQYMGSPVIFSHLRVTLKHGDLAEFRHRYETHTYFPDPKALPDPAKIERDKDTYRLALSACVKFHDLEWAREIWEERGKWRRVAASFQNLTPHERNQADALFARDLVTLLAICGETSEAVRLVMSTLTLKRWRWRHFERLHDVLVEQEDFNNLQLLEKVLGKRRPAL